MKNTGGTFAAILALVVSANPFGSNILPDPDVATVKDMTAESAHGRALGHHSQLLGVLYRHNRACASCAASSMVMKTAPSRASKSISSSSASMR
jgi:hypothetical protein